MDRGGLRTTLTRVLFRLGPRRLALVWAGGHMVVCGLGRKGYTLAMAALKAGFPVVVVEPDPRNTLVRPIREAGAAVVQGDGRETATQLRARVDTARYLLASTGDDAANIEIALRAGALPRVDETRPLDRLVHISDPALCRLMEKQELGAHDPAGLDVFNVHDRAAQAIARSAPFWRAGATTAERPPRLVLAGTGLLAQSLVLTIAWEWWAKQIESSSLQRIRIALVGPDAASVIDALRHDAPWLKVPADVEAFQVQIPSLEFARGGFLTDPDGRPDTSAVYVCLSGDSAGLSAGVRLLRATSGTDIEVTVCMPQEASEARLLEDAIARTSADHRLRTAGVISLGCSLDLLPAGDREELARAIHHRSRPEGEPVRSSAGTAPWGQVPAHARRSSREQADRYLATMDMIGCSIARRAAGSATRLDLSDEEVEWIARVDHGRSLVEKLARKQGRNRTDGELLGPDADLVPWDALSGEAKDLARRTVRNLSFDLEAAGFQICPLKYWEAGSRE